MTNLASLPWYDLPGHHDALDSLWKKIRTRLPARPGKPLPPVLERTLALPVQWSNKQLVLSQCCGSDLFTSQGSNLVPIARPVFAGLDCRPGNYFSHIVTHGNISSAPRVAVNALSSYSGCIALMKWLSRSGCTPSQTWVSGSHQASLALLYRRQVDVVAVDANTWNLLAPEGLVILGRSEEAPAPPFVRHKNNPIPHAAVREALAVALGQAAPVAGMVTVLDSTRRHYESMADEAWLALRHPDLGSRLAGGQRPLLASLPFVLT